MINRLLGLLVVVLSFGCQPPALGRTCGEGTREEGGACVTTLSCAAGTHREDGACVADPVTTVSCGSGTHLEGTACVVDGPAIEPPSPWSAPVPVCEEGVSCDSPTLVQTPAGAVVAVSESSAGEMTVAVYRQTASGFQVLKRFQGTNNVALTPSLAARGATLFLAYTDYEPSGGRSYGPGDLMLSVSGDFGATWSTPRRVNEQPATSLLYAPRLTVSAGGLDLVWTDTDGQTRSDNLYAHSEDDGLSFSAPLLLPAGSAYDSLSVSAPAVRVGDTVELPVLRSGYDLVNGGSLSAVEVLTVTSGLPPTTQTTRVKRVYATRDFPLDPVPVLDVSPGGVRCLAFVDAPSRDYGVFVVRSEGPIDGTVRPVLLPGGPGSTQTAPAVAATEEGDCELAWLDNRSGAWELFESTLKADGTWLQPRRVTQMPFAEDGIARALRAQVSLRRAPTGRQLAWSDFRGNVPSVSFSSAALPAQ